jgi:GntR family transcriptional regulator, carbon starvation induced regulator
MKAVMSLLERIDDLETIGEDGYRRIRTDIVLNRFKPEQKLKLDALKESYGISISTLREILCRLSAEGLVVAEGRRGFEVAPASVANLRELADLRILLETHAIAQSFASGDVEWEGRVVAAHHKLAQTERKLHDKAEDAERWKRYDSEFHHALISNCGSRTLMQAHAAVFDKYFRYQMIVLDYRGDEPAHQHETLLQCALKRDIAKAQQTLVAHVTNCVEHAVATGRLR